MLGFLKLLPEFTATAVLIQVWQHTEYILPLKEQPLFSDKYCSPVIKAVLEGRPAC
jgi:hypothetical protein